MASSFEELVQLFQNIFSQDMLHEKMVFEIETLKAYFILKTYLIKHNLDFNDLFFDEENEGYERLLQAYLDNPTDENFLNVLSHPMCEQHDRFVEIESHLAFPKKIFEHFSLTKRKLGCRAQSSNIFLTKKNREAHSIQNATYYQISL